MKMPLGSQFEQVWKNAWFGYLLIAVSVSVALWLVWHLPPPGFAIGALAVVAGVMALRPDMGGWEKWFFFVLLLAFMVIEIRAITKDRQDQDERFFTIARSLQTTVQNSATAINSLDRLIREDRQHFDEAMIGISASVKTQTGGDSFAYITFTAQPAPGQLKFPASPAPHFLVAITSHGRYPLREVHATMTDDSQLMDALQQLKTYPEANQLAVMQYTDTRYVVRYVVPYLRPQSPEAPTGQVEVLGVHPLPKGNTNTLEIAFSSLNGYWNEKLHLGLVDGTWRQCLSVMGPTVRQARKPFIYCDSEWPEGRALAEKDWHADKPLHHK